MSPAAGPGQGGGGPTGLRPRGSGGGQQPPTLWCLYLLPRRPACGRGAPRCCRVAGAKGQDAPQQGRPPGWTGRDRRTGGDRQMGRRAWVLTSVWQEEPRAGVRQGAAARSVAKWTAQADARPASAAPQPGDSPGSTSSRTCPCCCSESCPGGDHVPPSLHQRPGQPPHLPLAGPRPERAARTTGRGAPSQPRVGAAEGGRDP